MAMLSGMFGGGAGEVSGMPGLTNLPAVGALDAATGEGELGPEMLMRYLQALQGQVGNIQSKGVSSLIPGVGTPYGLSIASQMSQSPNLLSVISRLSQRSKGPN